MKLILVKTMSPRLFTNMNSLLCKNNKFYNKKVRYKCGI